MRNAVVFALLLVCLSVAAAGQGKYSADALYAAQERFAHTAAAEGEKSAFLNNLTEDAIVFRPVPTNGLKYWRDHEEPVKITVDRTVANMDMSSDGRLGYTTGMWRSTRKEGADDIQHYGEYITLWERREGQPFKVVLDITTRHDDIQSSFGGGGVATFDTNAKGWSATNDAMRYLRTAMNMGQGISTALKVTTMDDVRLLVDDQPPITGRDNVVEAAKRYTAIGFPSDVTIYQSGDMAYFWNQCRYQNSAEGLERGNCLQVMKLRNKKWWITLAAFARLDDDKPPVLAPGSKRKPR
jgi:ketosteroid isomerase-like protein